MRGLLNETFTFTIGVDEAKIILEVLRLGDEETKVCCKPYNEFEGTVPLMLSDDYKERFIAEYRQTKIRYERLKKFNTRIEAYMNGGKIDQPKHDCPPGMLREQQAKMGEYLHILELRAVIEGIEL